MPFDEDKAGTTHFYNDRCGEPKHNNAEEDLVYVLLPNVKKRYNLALHVGVGVMIFVGLMLFLLGLLM